MDFLTALIHLDPLTLVRTGGYIGVAALIFSESGILLGIFFPGDSLLFTAGVLAGAGFFNIALLIGVASAAAILGDSVGYWFGKKVGVRIFTKEDSFFFKQSYIAKTRAFYAQYGNFAIIMARFVPIVRTLAPMLAGVGEMPYRTFLISNMAGGILWATSITLIGYLLGAAIPNISHYLLPLTLVVIVISVLPIIWHVLRERKAKQLPTDQAL